MDLTLANQIVFQSTELIITSGVDLHNQITMDDCFTPPVKLPRVLPPKSMALLSTQETIEMAHGEAGIVCLRSSAARIGLVTPPTIVDPGFHGTLTLEICNANRRGILLRPGDSIFHMIVVPAPREKPYEGRYQGQTGITLPKALKFKVGE